MVGLTALGLTSPRLSAKLIGKALTEPLDRDLFLILVGLLFAVHLLSNAFSFLYSYQMRVLGGRVVFDLRRRMYDHLQRLSLGFYESRSSGEIISRMMNDVNSITSLVTGTVLNTLISSFKAVAILAMLFAESLEVTLMAIAVLPLHFLGYFFFNSRISHTAWKSSEKMSQIYGKVSEVLGAMKMVKSHSGEMRESRSLITQLRESYDINLYSGNLGSIWGHTTGNISYVGQVAVMLVCGIAVLDLELSLEQYVLLMSYVAMLYRPVSELIGVVQQILPAKVGIRRVFEIMDMEPEVVDRPDGARDRIRGEVVFEDVSFAYAQGDQVLTDVSFRAEPGEVVAFVGPSGSGKTTIANLIARFYDRSRGEITIDGRDIQEYALRTLREQMSIVLQETFLFRGTILDNVRYGKPEATTEEIEEAARLANAHEFICTLPDGYRSLIGSNGTRLSGGQRQRVAIARALIRNPRILILDEATSALDTVSESKVQDALQHLMQNRTTFIIAHRLSTIRNANKIVVLKEGRVEQIGGHEELIDEEGLYRELYDPDWAREQKDLRDERIEELARAAGYQEQTT
ncbi:MAG: ABC transporter ATP-binding protein [Candidatus Latescibacteria bacterium]|jgi:subfamily B ATP-binding cassette protein MsbA|nr:ABC transporter ATP-binding protein [Candidatus Latescibacterota bacterium]